MTEIKGFDKALQISNDIAFGKKITKKAKKEIRKNRILELMSQGIDKLTAEVMADCGL